MTDKAPAGDKGLRITEIFHSLQGESRPVGLPTAFIRLTGCPLRCTWCDTAYAFHGGERLLIDEVLARIATYATRNVCVTGGEPLAQPDCLVLLTALCDEGFAVSLETSGALDVSGVDERVVKIIDVKTPGSGEVSRNRWENFRHCTDRDQFKFVICDREDYEWARLKCEEHRLFESACEVLFSPSSAELPARDLADWIVGDRLPVRMQIQLHKYLWGDQPGR